MICSTTTLLKLTQSVLLAFGCEDHEAQIVSEHLVGANLAGHDSHGIGMLPAYGAQVQDGNLIPNQTPEVVRRDGAITVVDAKRGFGHRMTLLALDEAMESLAEHRVAILAMKNTGHLSRTGQYAEYCAERGLVSLHFVNVIGHTPLVAPFGGRQSAFSTNPISMAMPVNNEAFPMLDMATSSAAFGKVRVASNKGEQIPEGWLLDADGHPTTDPKPMAEEHQGTLTAFGKHKGSGLAIFAELLAGALVSEETVATADWIPNGAINNLLSIIIDPEGIGNRETIERSTRDFCDSIKNTPTTPDTANVLLPGEPEKISRKKRQEEGIDVDDETLNQIVDIGCQFGLNETDLRHLIAS
ncbi:MAG: malate/lactate/ureidoglycolate dehydrogenase [Granulosicoccus sp.]|nr:malate/lactate/ureidoglycolate dehydrogenase [Granulosicoccus sp.]